MANKHHNDNLSDVALNTLHCITNYTNKEINGITKIKIIHCLLITFLSSYMLVYTAKYKV